MSGRPILAIACAALALAGCGRAGEAADNAASPAGAAKAVMLIPPASGNRAAQSACAPAPMIVLSDDFADPRRAFAPGTAAYRRVEANFAAAYRGACERGLLRGRALVAAGAGERDRLRLKNAPDANVASIYLDGEDGAPAAARHMVLEYPFLTADGATHVPGTDDLGEAIFCSVQGASQQEEEESGRCLPD